MDIQCKEFEHGLFMSPPLGAGGIMFSGCPSVRPSVHLGKRKRRIVTFTIPFEVFTYHIKTLQEESAKKSNIPWIWRIIYGHKLPYMKKTKITLYEEDKKEEASMRCSLLHGSWDQILRRRPSVRPSEAWNTLFWPVHGSVGPPNQPLLFYGMSVRPSVRLSVRPSGEVSGHLLENAWRD